MNNRIKLCDVVARLNENKMPYEILTLEDSSKIVITKYGGRVLGPFKGQGESLLWINAAFADKQAFQAFIQENEWNLGGDRYWVAPEHPLFVKERKNFYDSYVVPQALDPGQYFLSRQKDAVELYQTVKTDVYESPIVSKEFQITRRIISLKNPLLSQPETEKLKIGFCGYEHEFTLEELSDPLCFSLEPWNLLQVNPGGKIVIPYTGNFDFVDYYEPVSEQELAVCEGYAALSVDGYRRYKAAFYAVNTFGRAAYINRNEEGYYLIFKQYYNDPSNPYCSDPWDQPGKRGCSLSVYNDNGSNGGYAEFENNGVTIGEGTNRTKATSYLAHMFFTGEKDQLEKLIAVLLGIKYQIIL